MQTVMVNGVKYQVLPAGRKALEHGEMLYWREHRRAYRFMCLDGDDYIMRNARHPDLFDVLSRDVVEGELQPITPIA